MTAPAHLLAPSGHTQNQYFQSSPGPLTLVHQWHSVTGLATFTANWRYHGHLLTTTHPWSQTIRICPFTEDCSTMFKAGITTSGVYNVNPDSKGAFPVYCDMTTDGGGWTVFQRRQDGSQDFYLGWSEYKAGFGQLTGEFWLGLDKIHRLTASRPSELRVEVGDWSGGRAYAKYSSFGVGDEQSLYQLSVGSYSGSAGDSLAYQNNMKFSTKDRDNDQWSENCAVSYTGAWWYNHCHHSNLNGQYLGNTESSKGARWHHYKRSLSLKFTEMKLQPTK